MTFFSVFTVFARRTNRSAQGRSRALVALGTPLIAVLTLSACGPTLYSMEISTAVRVVAQAEQARGAELSPFEFHYAELNLEKAKEEAAEASYEDAVRFARVASKYGKIARDQALAHLEAQSRAPMMIDERPETNEQPSSSTASPSSPEVP